MATLFKKISDDKIYSRTYTPSHIINKMLNEIGFISENLVGKRILDPACGEGRFLK